MRPSSGEDMFRFDETFRAEISGNWPALVVAFSCLLLGFSAPAFALPFVFSEVIAEFGWTREQATLLASAKYLTGAVAALLVGRFVDVMGVRSALALTIGIGGFALVSFLWVPNLTVYYLSGVMLGLAGPGAMVAVKVLVSRTFHASQGTAMGVALLGTSLGSVIVPLIVAALIAALGWRAGIAAMSLGIWFIALPMLYLGFFSRAIASIDVPRLGRQPTKEEKAERKAKNRASTQALLVLTRNPSFWLIAAAVFIAALVDQAFIQHQVLIFNDLGLSREMTALGISAIGLIGIACRVLIGNLLDRSSHKGLSFLYLTLTATALFAFLLVNPLIFFGFIILRAVGHAAVLLDTTVMTKHAFGLENYGTLIGIYTAIVSLGFAIGPWIMGRLYDMSGSYNSSFILFTVLPIVAAVLIWFMKPAYWIPVSPAVKASATEAGVIKP